MFPILLKIGPLTVHTYGLLVATGFLVGFTFARKEFSRRGLSLDFLDKLLLALMIGAIFGARLFYVLLVNRSSFLQSPLSFFRIWEGGLVFFGGFLAAWGVLFFFARKNKLSFLLLADALVIPLLIAHAFGRLGCFAAGCCYGNPTLSFLAVTFTHPDSLAPLNMLLHPTQLYSAFGNLVLFLGAWGASRRKYPVGSMVVYYLMGYGLFRFCIEFLRSDYRGDVFMHLHPSQWIALALMLLGVGLGTYVWKRQR